MFTCSLDPCRSWLLEAAQFGGEAVVWVGSGSGQLFFRASEIPLHLKEALVCSLIKKSSLDLTILDNFHPISNLSFQGRCWENGWLDEQQASTTWCYVKQWVLFWRSSNWGWLFVERMEGDAHIITQDAITVWYLWNSCWLLTWVLSLHLGQQSVSLTSFESCIKRLLHSGRSRKNREIVCVPGLGVKLSQFEKSCRFPAWLSLASSC